MKGKVLFVVGVGVGYVLGSRAGRQRYEQIKSAAESVWNTPTVQNSVTTVKDFALARVGDVSDTVLDNVKSLIGSATKSTGGTKTDVKGAARSAKADVSKAAGVAHGLIDDTASKLGEVIDDTAEAASKADGAKPTTPRTSTAKPRTAKTDS